MTDRIQPHSTENRFSVAVDLADVRKVADNAEALGQFRAASRLRACVDEIERLRARVPLTPVPPPDEDALAFARDIATNYDHEEDAHRHNNGACRVCNAEKLLAKLGADGAPSVGCG